MKIKPWKLPLIGLIISLISVNLLGASPARATNSYVEGNDKAAVLFDPMQVSSINLTMSTTNFNSLKYPAVSWDNEGDWRETTMLATVSGKTYGPYRVGVHLKGAWGSWRDVTGKAAFKIKMDAFVPEQKLLGVTKLTLNNMVQDPSYVHELMTYRLMRAAGVPAPRVGYAGVTLNGINYGLHLNVETLNKEMLERWGISSQHLYKGSLPTFPEFDAGNEHLYTVESGDETDISDLTNFLAVNQLSGEAWWNAISQIADMKSITVGWAVELYSGHWDGYLRNRNNYYLNIDKNGQAIMLIWGTDQTWGGTINYFDSGTLLPTRCRESVSCQEMYLQSLAKVALVARNINLTTMVRDVRAMLREYIISDPFGPGIQSATPNQDWSISIQEYRATELAQMVAPWDTTLSSIKVNNKTYTADEIVYLAPGTKLADITLTPTQTGIQPVKLTKKLKPGLNEYGASFTSIDGFHANLNTARLYVLTQRSQKIVLTYATKVATLSPTNLQKLTTKKTLLLNAKNISITFTVSKSLSSNLANVRVGQIQKLFADAGIKAKVQLVRSGTLAKDSLLLDLKYQN